MQIENIEIIDGTALLDLIKKHLPGLNLFSMEVPYRYEIQRSMNRIPESKSAFDLLTELELNNIYVDPSLDSTGKYLANIASKPLRLEAKKLVTVTPSHIRELNDICHLCAITTAITDPPIIDAKDKKKQNRYLELCQDLRKYLKEKIIELNIDPLLQLLQGQVRDSLSKLSRLTSCISNADCTRIGKEFLETKE